MHQDGFIGGGQAATCFGMLGLVFDGCVDIAVDEVCDHFNVPRDLKTFNCFFLEVVGDGSDAVALLNGIAGDREVAAVEPYESDVGAMESSDKGETAAPGCEHLAGQQRADRMGDGVMDVEEIEIIEFGHLDHPGGKCEIVGRELEERIAGDGDLVIEDALFATVKAEWLRIGDEVDLVAERRQFDAQFGCYNARSAVSGVTSDADAHRVFLDLFWLEWVPADLTLHGPAKMQSRGSGWCGAGGISERLGRRDAGIGDEFDGGEFFDGVESFALDVARGAEAGADFIEIGIVVAGVRDEFPCAGGELAEQGAGSGGVEDSGADYGDGPVGGGEAFFCDDSAAGGLQLAEDVDLGGAGPRGAGCGADGPYRFEGIADGADSGGTGGAEHGAQDCWKHVGVFVGVDVGEAQAAGLEQGDLRGGFGLDFG